MPTVPPGCSPRLKAMKGEANLPHALYSLKEVVSSSAVVESRAEDSIC